MRCAPGCCLLTSLSGKLLSVVNICGTLAPADLISEHHQLSLRESSVTNSFVLSKTVKIPNGERQPWSWRLNYSRSVRPSVFCQPWFSLNQGRVGSARQEYSHRRSWRGHTPLTHTHQGRFRVQSAQRACSWSKPTQTAGSTERPVATVPIATSMLSNHVSLCLYRYFPETAATVLKQWAAAA